MKPRTAFLFRTGLGLAVLATVVALNSIRAASDDTDEPNEAAELASSTAAPPAPAGPPQEAPPAIPALVPLPVEVSPGMEEVFKLARAGVSEEVLAAYVEKSGVAYEPSAEEIIYLKDLGVAPAVIASVIRAGQKDSTLAQQIEGGDFTGVEKDAAAPATGSHFAAAPQPLAETAAPTADATLDLDYFRSSLSPYGRWVYIDGYGECWQPTIAVSSSSWRPYYDGGRWIYTDSGWYWLSDYSWGWGPFHYGRWHNHHRWGWVWTPGYTWGPAWVEWRTTGAYCGWAPLPPYYGTSVGVAYSGGSFGFSISWGSYNWIPYRYCYGYYPRYYGVHHDQKKVVYNNSTVINNTIIGDNNTVIITGPDSTVVARNSGRTEIKRVTLRDSTVNVRGPVSGPREYLENGGTALATFRPPSRRNGSAATANSGGELSGRQAEARRESGASSLATSTTARSGTSAIREIGKDGSIYLRGQRNVEASTSTTTRAEPTRSTGTPSTAGRTDVTRTSGQHTTINRNPDYPRPATTSTTILGSPNAVTVVRRTTVSSPVVSGGIRTETTRSAPSLSSAPGADVGRSGTPRQSVRPAPQSDNWSTTPEAPRIAPARTPAQDARNSSATYRSENRRSAQPSYTYPGSTTPSSTPVTPRTQSLPRAMDASAPARSTFNSPVPAPRFSTPVPSSSYTAPTRSFTPAETRSFTPAPAPTRAPEPTRSISSPPPSAPSRAPVSAPPPSRGGGGGGGNRGPSRQ